MCSFPLLKRHKQRFLIPHADLQRLTYEVLTSALQSVYGVMPYTLDGNSRQTQPRRQPEHGTPGARSSPEPSGDSLVVVPYPPWGDTRRLDAAAKTDAGCTARHSRVGSDGVRRIDL